MQDKRRCNFREVSHNTDHARAAAGMDMKNAKKSYADTRRDDGRFFHWVFRENDVFCVLQKVTFLVTSFLEKVTNSVPDGSLLATAGGGSCRPLSRSRAWAVAVARSRNSRGGREMCRWLSVGVHKKTPPGGSCQKESVKRCFKRAMRFELTTFTLAT